MRRRIVAGNWKMNTTYAEAMELVDGLKASLTEEVVGETGVIITPPALYLSDVVGALVLGYSIGRPVHLEWNRCQRINGQRFSRDPEQRDWIRFPDVQPTASIYGIGQCGLALGLRRAII